MPRGAVAEAEASTRKSPKKVKEETAVDNVTARLTGTMTIGGMTDKLIELRDRKRDLEAQVKLIEVEYEGISDALLEKATAEGMDKGAGKKGSFSISTNTVANVTDWDALNAYIKKTGHFHLYQRRVSDPAFRELLEAGKKVPGAEPFTKRRVNLRSGT